MEPKIIKAAQVIHIKQVNNITITYKGDPYKVIEQVKTLGRSGQLTFNVGPEGSIGDMVFESSQKQEIEPEQ